MGNTLSGESHSDATNWVRHRPAIVHLRTWRPCHALVGVDLTPLTRFPRWRTKQPAEDESTADGCSVSVPMLTPGLSPLSTAVAVGYVQDAATAASRSCGAGGRIVRLELELRMPRRWHHRTSRSSMFTPLIMHIASRREECTTLTLARIEKLIRHPLSDSARQSNSYWHGSHERLRNDLTAIGWRASLDAKRRVVEFRRLPGESRKE